MLERFLQPDQLAELEKVGFEAIKEFFEQQKKPAPDWPVCNCKGCRDEQAAYQRQLDHPFYDRVDRFRDEIKQETLYKASQKYKEPFNPASWSIRQLGKHAMAENYDQGNYIVGLMEAAEELEKQYKALQGLYAKDIKKVGELTDFLVNDLPEVGKIGENSIDVAIRALKDYKFQKDQAEFWRLRAIQMAQYIKNGVEFGYIDDREKEYEKFTKGVVIDERV